MDLERIDQRIEELKAHYQDGQKQMQRLEAQREELRSTLLRISGAIQVLEELRRENANAASGSAIEPQITT